MGQRGGGSKRTIGVPFLLACVPNTSFSVRALFVGALLEVQVTIDVFTELFVRHERHIARVHLLCCAHLQFLLLEMLCPVTIHPLQPKSLMSPAVGNLNH